MNSLNFPVFLYHMCLDTGLSRYCSFFLITERVRKQLVISRFNFACFHIHAANLKYK